MARHVLPHGDMTTTAMLVTIGSMALGAPATAQPRTGYIAMQPAEAQSAGGEATTVFYLNRSGGTFAPGEDDASRDRSSIVRAPAMVPAWEVADDVWSDVLTCVRGRFARWNVSITDVDPGSAPHLEVVVGGRSSDLGIELELGGLAPFAEDCSVIPRAIVFVFAEIYGEDRQAICNATAQELAHSLGLDHQLLCSDPMSYLEGCGEKAFQDADARCGEYGTRMCACGGDTQNSVTALTDVLGLAGAKQVAASTGCSTGGGGPGLLAMIAVMLSTASARRRRRQAS